MDLLRECLLQESSNFIFDFALQERLADIRAACERNGFFQCRLIAISRKIDDWNMELVVYHTRCL